MSSIEKKKILYLLGEKNVKNFKDRLDNFIITCEKYKLNDFALNVLKKLEEIEKENIKLFLEKISNFNNLDNSQSKNYYYVNFSQIEERFDEFKKYLQTTLLPLFESDKDLKLFFYNLTHFIIQEFKK